MSAENVVQRQVWLAIGGSSTLFRLNTGQAWLPGAGPAQRLKDGSVLVPAGRPVAMGFGAPNGKPVVGAGDLIGWTTVRITPDMVGQEVAVVTSIETKRTKGGRASPEQINWMKQIQAAGGIAGIANSVDAARSIFDAWHERFRQRVM